MTKPEEVCIEDLEMSNNSNNEDEVIKSNAVADIAAAIETILSEEHIDQKTIITSENEEGLIGIDVIQSHMMLCFNFEYPALIALKISKQEHAISVGGKGREQIVEIMKSLQPQVITGEANTLSRKFLGR